MCANRGWTVDLCAVAGPLALVDNKLHSIAQQCWEHEVPNRPSMQQVQGDLAERLQELKEQPGAAASNRAMGQENKAQPLAGAGAASQEAGSRPGVGVATQQTEAKASA